jgi:hypothetical protein
MKKESNIFKSVNVQIAMMNKGNIKGTVLKSSRKKINKIRAICKHVLIITLIINILNPKIRRNKLYDWVKSKSICYLHDTHFAGKDTYR